MKKFLTFLAIALSAVLLATSGKPKVSNRQVIFKADLHCAKCAEKVTENISFEKGVKDLEVSVDEKTVRIVYNPSKTDAAALKAAIEKLGYKAELIEEKAL